MPEPDSSPTPVPEPPPLQAFGPAHFINRELSWLDFNNRVLDEAMDESIPLLERLKFYCISSSNLDEFFEVRVAGIKQQIESEVLERSLDGLTPTQTFDAVMRRIRRMVRRQGACWQEQLLPALAKAGIRFFEIGELGKTDLEWITKFYQTEVHPVLTPLSIDPAHPFPQLQNKSLNIMAKVEMAQEGQILRHLAVVQVPQVLSRLIPLPRKTTTRKDYVLLGHLICHFLKELFPGTKILGHWHFRLTRNSELYIDEEETANLLKAVETELHNRRRGDAVRLEVEQGCPREVILALLKTLRLKGEDLYVLKGPLNPIRFMAIYAGDHSPELRDAPFVARETKALTTGDGIFEAIKKGDILVHHPYDHFDSVVRFLESAAVDHDVLAIKLTLYRTGGDERIVGALMRAVQNGKQVTAVIELRARFDEANNVQWARRLEEAGVHVVYGLVGYKIHGKMCLVVRKDPDRIRRYLHLATGNYNPNTARVYTDVGFFTCREDFGEDATDLFNLLTGICQFQPTRKLIVAPYQVHLRLLELIQREQANAEQGLPARIIAKMNALVDREIIEALYRASQAGARIDLIVRGICCLRPGVRGVSETISVRSIIDRFLEHSRLFYFENACRPEVFAGSADWMPRNFYRRVEVLFPIEDGLLRERVMSELLDLPLRDNVKARLLQPDGKYAPAQPADGEPALRSQWEFIRRASGGDTERESRAPGSTPENPHMQLMPGPQKAAG